MIVGRCHTLAKPSGLHDASERWVARIRCNPLQRCAGVLPASLGRTAYGLALLNVAFIPAIYFGTDPARFYSAIGWGNSAFVASLMGYWVAAAGVALGRRSTTESSATNSPASRVTPEAA